MQRLLIFLVCFVGLLPACRQKEAPSEEDEVTPEEVRTPVTVTAVTTGTLTDSVELNATSAFLQSNFIKASANGYLQWVGIRPGQYIGKGQLAFTLKTKEAKALGNTINALDTSFHFSGLIRIRAAQAGFVSQLNHQVGDYVQEGEQLAVLSIAGSFGFLLNLPYELRPYLQRNPTIPIILPDGARLNGRVSTIIPTVDSATQTQSVLIRVTPSAFIPEHLIGKVRLVTRQKENAVTLPKAAVLSDESQTSFWIMKMADSTTAVKVPVVRGMETADRVEIISPRLTAADKIVLTGNYGLPDTARVKIEKQP